MQNIADSLRDKFQSQVSGGELGLFSNWFKSLIQLTHPFNVQTRCQLSLYTTTEEKLPPQQREGESLVM